MASTPSDTSNPPNSLTDAMSEWNEIVDALIDHATLLRELGARTIELDPALLSFPPLDAPATVKAARPSAQAETSPRPLQAEPAVVTPTPTTSAALEDRRHALDAIAERLAACAACELAATRTRCVPGQGNPDSPDVMFIGEAPGEEEDRQGLAFVGPAGQLLTRMIEAMGYTRDEVFIANICKCRPPGNRAPLPQEMRACLPFLRQQIRIIRPRTLVLLGRTAIQGLLASDVAVSRAQGQWTHCEGIPTMPTYHPSYILRFESPSNAAQLKQVKSQVWNALKLVMAHLGKTLPARSQPPSS